MTDLPTAADLPPLRGVNLKPWERSVAAIFGLAGTGVGGVGIFLSENQAGTTAILILGAAFMLMAIQGTPIRKASEESLEMADREAVDRTVGKAKVKLKEEGPGEARAVLEGATAARPDITDSPGFRRFSASVYEEEVQQAIMRAWFDTFNEIPVIRSAGTDDHYDFVICDRGDGSKKIAVEVLPHLRTISGDTLLRYVGRARTSTLAWLIVSSHGHVTTEAAELMGQLSDEDRTGMIFYIYQGPEDSVGLKKSLIALREMGLGRAQENQ
ncbi:MAG: hypothetical protein ACR2GH_14030 [Pseudonocardia sp.]